MRELLFLFILELREQPVLLLGIEKSGVGRAIGKKQISEEAEEDGRQSLEHQEPAPATEAEPVYVVQYDAGNGCTDNAGDRQAGDEERGSLGHVALTEPVGEVQDNSRKISGFGQAQQESHDIELVHVLHKTRQSSDKPPTEQDAGDPNASADLVQQVVAGYFEKEIAEEEDAAQKAELLAGNRQVLVHGQGGKTNVNAVDEGNDEDSEQKWNEPNAYLANRVRFKWAREDFG